MNAVGKGFRRIVQLVLCAKTRLPVTGLDGTILTVMVGGRATPQVTSLNHRLRLENRAEFGVVWIVVSTLNS